MTTTTDRSTARIPTPAAGTHRRDAAADTTAGPPAAERSAPPLPGAAGAPVRAASRPAGDPARSATDRPRASRSAHRTPELLAALPYRLGFRPEECLLAVGLRGPDRDVGLVARIGLDDVLSPAGPDLLDDVAGHLAADHATEVVVVVYSADGDPGEVPAGVGPDGGTVPHRAAEEARVALDPLGPVTTWVVSHGRYLSPECPDTTCCPLGGRPLAELEPGAAAGLAAGRDRPLPRRAELVAVPVAAAGRRRSAAAGRSRWVDARLRASDPAALLRWRQRSLRTWREAVADARRTPDGSAGPRPARLGRIEAALDDTTLRDAVVLALIRPDSDLPDALLRHLPHAGGVVEDEKAGAADAAPGASDPAVARAAHPEAPDAPGPGAGQGADAGAADREPAPADAASVSAAVRRTLDVLLEPEHAEPPHPDATSAARSVLEAVVAHGRSGRQAPACTLLALLAWWAGDVVRARLLLDRALAEDPSHRLAELLDRALGVGLTPGWMRRRC